MDKEDTKTKVKKKTKQQKTTDTVVRKNTKQDTTCKVEETIVKTFKLRIYPTSAQKVALNQWVGASRFTYNQALSAVNNTTNTLRGWMTLRNRFVTAKTNDGRVNTFFNNKPWLSETPKSVRLQAVKEVCQNRKSCFTNKKNGNIEKFNIQYKSKKKEKQNGWSIGIEKNNVMRKEDKLFIFPRILGEMRISSKKQLKKLIPGDKPCCDPRIQRNRYGEYYLLASIKQNRLKENKKESENIVSIDRGVKIFATCYDPRGKAIMYGKDVDKQFLDMLETLDDLISTRDVLPRKDKTRQKLDRRICSLRKKIMNCKNELHNQFNNFVTKHYTMIICPKLDTQKLSLKERRQLRTKTVRSMLNLGHCNAHNKLIDKCRERGVEMLSPSEAYTSKTCPSCGDVKQCTNSRLKVCQKCNYIAERDLNGALNILLRSLY